MEHILEKARELGRMIAESEQFRGMNAQEEKLSANPEVAELYAQYADLRDRIATMELEGQAEAQIAALEDQAMGIQRQLGALPGMVELNLARLNFNRLMDRINRALQAQLTGEPELDPDEEGCGSGGCAGCSGCGPER